jgi:predicted phage-related endonuclease
VSIERIAITSREQWLSLRMQDITASDVAIVCGEAAYGSQAELYAEKKGLRPPLTDNPVLRRGRWDEPAVFEALAEYKPHWELTRAKIYLRDPELRLGATPDGFALAPEHDGPGIVQAKSVSRFVFRNRWMVDPGEMVDYGEADPPPYYILQTLTEMMLSGANWGVLAVIIKGEFDASFRMFPIDRDPGLEYIIKDSVRIFWNDYLDPCIMPPFDPQRDSELIKLLYRADKGTSIDLTYDNRALELVDDLTELQAARKRITKQETEIKNELQAKLGDNTFGNLRDGRCLSWKTQPRRAYTVPASAPRVLRILKHKPQPQEQSEDVE